MKKKTVILAAGDFPRTGTEAWRLLLDDSVRVVCCDGAADAYRKRMNMDPDVVVGDLDSVAGDFGNVVMDGNQETNDLEKALRLCGDRGWNDVVLLGAVGGRDDHTLGNLFIGMEHGVEIITDHGRFVPVVRELSYRVGVGAAVSVFANPGTRMSSVGLQWPLDGVEFDSFHRATLNRATEDVIRVSSDRPAYVYVCL